MINKTTSIHATISKVVRDLGLGDKEVPWQDMIEWIAEGLAFIGAYTQFEEKECLIAIEDYKGTLPCDFHKSINYLDGCNFGDSLIYPYWDIMNTILDEIGWTATDSEADNVYETMKITDMKTFQELQLLQYSKVKGTSYSGRLRGAANLMGNGYTYTGLDNSYRVNLDTVTATFRYGYIALRYLAFPVDSTGYPLVPDDPAFQEALMWRCAEKLALRGYEFKQQRLNDPEYAKLYWNKYCMQARGNANAPDPDMLQRLANTWSRLIPNQYQYYEDFNNLGDPNIRNLNGFT